jgi:hypothetical protein
MAANAFSAEQNASQRYFNYPGSILTVPVLFLLETFQRLFLVELKRNNEEMGFVLRDFSQPARIIC